MFFAAYAGPSMNPTLREPEIMEIRSYDGQRLRVGDVAFFLPPEADQPVVHRIVRMTPAGIFTLGDNNTQEDTLLLQPKSIKGRVVAAWRGQKRRKIAGGWQGRLTRRRLRWRRVLDRGVSPLLRPLYQALSRWGWIAGALPASFRPRVVVFRVQGRDQFRLLLGRRIIGRYDDRRRQWRIQRPFRLIFKGRAFTVEADPRAKPGALTSDVNTRLSTAEADPQTKPGAPAAAPATADGKRLPRPKDRDPRSGLEGNEP